MKGKNRPAAWPAVMLVALLWMHDESAASVPSRVELEKAMSAVHGRMTSEWRLLEKGEKTLADVAEVSLSRGATSASPAERFLFEKGAIDLFVRAGELKKAAEALTELCAEFGNLPTVAVESIVASAAASPDVVHRTLAIAKEKSAPLVVDAEGWRFPERFDAARGCSLEIANGVRMAFTAVPSGTFDMTNADGTNTHRVTITRPFWITRTHILARELGAFVPDDERSAKADWLSERFPWADVEVFTSAEQFDRLCDELNSRFGRLLPEGYVFRLPTEAELEQAIRLGEAGRSVSALEQMTRRELAAGGHDWVPGFRLLPTAKRRLHGIAVGFTDCAEHVADRVDDAWLSQNSKAQYDANAGRVALALGYADGETDPLRHGSFRMVRFRAAGRIIGKRHPGLARIVVAPKLD